jgi:phenylalanyl-tRNA synthetase beta chain
VQGSIVVNGAVCGFFGLMHPRLRDRLALDGVLLYAQIDMASLLFEGAKKRKARWLSEYPSVTRDLTIELSRDVFAGKVVDYISLAQAGPLQRVDIVDSFQKKGESFRRVTYRLLFQSDSRTLEREEVDACVEGIIAALRDTYQLHIAGVNS